MKLNIYLTVNDLASKFKSKAGLYNVPTKDGYIYLLPKQD